MIRRPSPSDILVAVAVVVVAVASSSSLSSSSSSRSVDAFAPPVPPRRVSTAGGVRTASAAAGVEPPRVFGLQMRGDNGSSSDDDGIPLTKKIANTLAVLSVSAALVPSVFFGGLGGLAAANADTPASASATYDGFAEYAKENKMEKSDVGCFVSKCGEQTKALFSNPRGIKGVSCLGRCKGEQSCATRCFAEFGSEDLNSWLSCTIEDNECVKVPKNVDNSAEETGYAYTVEKFDPKTLVGKWYKTDGLNPNYDLFDCQTNTFESPAADASELDMGIFLRVTRPPELGGGYWENDLSEHMIVDAASASASPAFPNPNPSGRTMHTEGKMYGLKFSENWYVLGESDGKGDVPEFKLVAYKGHTLQGNYEGSFVYAKEPVLPEGARGAVREAAKRAGLDFDEFTRIDNTCPTTELALNDPDAGTGTSTTDWIDLVIGEGGVIDWVVPGWRGEYNKK